MKYVLPNHEALDSLVTETRWWFVSFIVVIDWGRKSLVPVVFGNRKFCHCSPQQSSSELNIVALTSVQVDSHSPAQRPPTSLQSTTHISTPSHLVHTISRLNASFLQRKTSSWTAWRVSTTILIVSYTSFSIVGSLFRFGGQC